MRLPRTTERRRRRVWPRGKKQGITLTEIANDTNLPASTVKRHLDQLVSIGTVHIQTFGSFNVYQWNGVGAYQHKIHLSENHVLFVYALTNRYGTPYIRMKESRKVQNEWKDMGVVIISPEKVKELLRKLNAIYSSVEKSRQDK